MAKHIVGASHYHQAYGRHPRAHRIPTGREHIELVTGGRGWVEHDGQLVETRVGDLWWHQAGQQTISRSDFDNPYRCLAINFETDPDEGAVAPCHFARWENDSEIIEFTQEVLRTLADTACDRDLLLDYVIARLKFRIHRWQSRQQTHIPEALQQFLAIINKRYEYDWSINELANEIGWSEQHFYARCREFLDASPHQLLNQRRLRAARELLAGGNDPIQVIAQQCGFAGAAQFSRTFRQQVGQSPSRYRRQYREWEM